MRVKAGEKMAVVGHFHRGKTTAGRTIAELAPKSVAFDPTGALAKDGWKPCRVDNVLDVVQKEPRVAVQGDPQVDFDGFCRKVIKLRGYVVLLDEINQCVPGTSPGAVRGGFSALWRYAHKENTTLIWTGHRIAEVPVILRYVEHTLHFGTRERVDLDYIEKEWGPEWREKVEQLDDHRYVYRDAAGILHEMPRFELTQPVAKNAT